MERAERLASSGLRFGPVIDDYLLTRAPLSALGEAGRSGIELLVGSNSREGLAVIAPDQLPQQIRTTFGPNADRALAIYGLANGATGSVDPLLGSAGQQFATDSTFRCGSVEFAQLAAAAAVPTWQYQFEQFVPGKEAQGAAHSFEVPYVFGNLLRTGFSAANYGSADRRLSDVMVRYWTNFAKRGDPNGPGLQMWPRYKTPDRSYLRFSSALPRNAQVARDLRGAACRLFPPAN